MTGASKKDDDVLLDRVSCIHYLLCFYKNKKNEIRALINSGSKVNVMTLAYTLKLGLKVRRTNVGAQKIDGSTLEMFGMVLASFQIEDKLERAWFFQETFLLADISEEVVLRMPFFTLNNADIQFAKKNLTWRLYILRPRLCPPLSGWKLLTKKNSLKRR